MAKILMGAFVGAISGSISGTTFSNNRSGAYAKKKPIKKFKPGSDLSDTVNIRQSGSPVSGVRSRFSALSKAWKSLSSATRNSFNSAVNDWKQTDALGNEVTLSGFNLFVKLNGVLGSLFVIAVNKTVMPDALTSVPAKITFDGVADAQLSFTPTTMTINPTTAGKLPFSNDSALLIEATRPMSAGVSKPSDSDFRQVLVQNEPSVDEEDAPIAINVRPAYIATFGNNFEAGQVIFVRMSMVSITAGQKNTYNQFVEKIAVAG